MFDQQLLNLLVCPSSKGPLRLSEDESELICRASGLAYPIKDGIPCLIVEEARELTSDEILGGEDE